MFGARGLSIFSKVFHRPVTSYSCMGKVFMIDCRRVIERHLARLQRVCATNGAAFAFSLFLCVKGQGDAHENSRR